MAEEAETHNEVSGQITGGVVQARTVTDGVHEMAQHAHALGHAEIRQAGRDQYNVGGDVHMYPSPQPMVVPRQLPPAPPWFTGRTDELAMLTASLDDVTQQGAPVGISAIGGVGGIGKTWLALHWAHRHRDRFPDGQLFVNLRGFAPDAEPIAPAVAVRGFLDAFGLDPDRIPVELDAQVGLYRSLVADRRMLIVLDNARDTSQLAPLLPGDSTCTVLVTSRRHLAGLVTTHGALALDLTVLSEGQARQLLTAHLGAERVAPEPDAVAELLECCAGLPLALSIVAARATRHPSFALSVLAEELRDHATRLDGLDAGEIPLNLRSVFSWSYDALSAEATVLFGLLSLVPGPDISLPATASLMGLPVTEVRRLLREVEAAHLVTQPVPGRYHLHDLIRLYATDQAHRDQTENSRDTALRRLVDFYLHTAHTGNRLIDQQRPPIEIPPPAPGCNPHPLPDQTAAQAWFEAEYHCLLATQRLAGERRWHGAVWQLAWNLTAFHYRRGHLYDNLQVWQAGLAAADHEGDLAVIMRAHAHLGHACAEVGRHPEALDHLGQALDIAPATGDRLGQAIIHHTLARAWGRRGDAQQGLEHATNALHLVQSLDDPEWEAAMLNSVGWFSARLGYYQQALIHCQTALALFRRNDDRHDDRHGEADTLDSLGYLAYRTGRHEQALDYYQQALTLFRETGHAYHEADTLDHLGEVHTALGQDDQARHTWRQALELYRAQHRTQDADRVTQQLADPKEPSDATER